MNRPGFDFRRFVLASVLVIGIGIALVILGIILQLLTFVISGTTAATIELVSSLYSILMLIVFFVLYFWSGIRAVKRFHFDAVGAGGVTAFSYLVTAAVQLFLDFVLSLVVVSKGGVAQSFSSSEAAIAASILGGVAGFSGIGIAAICGVGLIIIGTLINFVVGGAGGLFAQRKSVQSED